MSLFFVSPSIIINAVISSAFLRQKLSVYNWKMIAILRIDGIDKELNYFCSTDKCSCHTSQISKSNHY